MVAYSAPTAATDRTTERETHQRRGMVVVDLTAIAIAVGITLLLQVGASAPLRLDTPRLIVLCALLLLWPLMLWEMQSRATTVLGQGPEEYRRVLMASVWTLCFAAVASYFTGTTRARDTLVVAVLLGTALLFLGRNVMRSLLHHRLRRKGPLHRVFVVAPDSQEAALGDRLANTGGIFAKVGAWPLHEGSDPDPQAVVAAALRSGADTLLYAPGSHADVTWPRRLGWSMEDTSLSLLISPALTDVAGPRMSIEQVEGLPLLRVDMPRFSGPARVVKRTVDLVGSVVGMVLLAIPLVIVAALIKKDSPGPVFFRQLRAGAGGTTFTCWKLRTMSDDADEQRAALRSETDSDSATFKLPADPRITGIGRFLRRFSLDELPQLFNVLKGDMSLVGPRPHPLDDVQRYDDIATRRLLAKPGMTGLWQVSGRSDLDWKEAVTLDLYYIENWSLSLDFVIFMRTVKAVLAGEGAY